MKKYILVILLLLCVSFNLLALEKKVLSIVTMNFKKNEMEYSEYLSIALIDFISSKIDLKEISNVNVDVQLNGDKYLGIVISFSTKEDFKHQDIYDYDGMYIYLFDIISGDLFEVKEVIH